MVTDLVTSSTACDNFEAALAAKEAGCTTSCSSSASTPGASKQGTEAAARAALQQPSAGANDSESTNEEEEAHESESQEQEEAPQQLRAGLFDEDDDENTAENPSDSGATAPPSAAAATGTTKPGTAGASNAAITLAPTGEKFQRGETFFIFDWDDTVLPSTWVQRQGLRLDAASKVTLAQREVLAEVAAVAGRTLQAARQHGTVVLITNAERGWIELSCQKFLPTLAPMLENVKLVSARTTYEHSACKAPQSWKLHAFEAEITSFFGSDGLFDASKRKNIFSLGDSIHEREALLRVAASVPGCYSKSLKFVERPDIRQICKQHELINNAFGQIVHHEGHMDLCIQCP